jgi:hypothetical protein
VLCQIGILRRVQAAVNGRDVKTSARYAIDWANFLPGERDAYFNLPRATYYALESDGQLELIRLRQRGRVRGTTLVSTADVLAILDTAEKGKDGTGKRSLAAIRRVAKKKGGVVSAQIDTGPPRKKEGGPHNEAASQELPAGYLRFWRNICKLFAQTSSAANGLMSQALLVALSARELDEWLADRRLKWRKP